MRAILTRLPSVVVLTLLACGAALASSPAIDPRLFDERLARVNELLSEANTPDRTETITAELEKLYRTRDDEVQAMTLLWFGRFRSHLGDDDTQARVLMRVIDADPGSESSKSMRRTLGVDALRSRARPARAVTYSEAIAAGRVPIAGTEAFLTREQALYFAAQEGIDELRPKIREFSALLDRQRNAWDCRNSDALDVMMEFRSGAPDRRSAPAIHAGRFCELSSPDLASRLIQSPGFAMASALMIEEVCRDGREAAACMRVAAALSRARAVGTPTPEAKEAYRRFVAILDPDARARYKRELQDEPAAAK